jgi:hypothetical protein
MGKTIDIDRARAAKAKALTVFGDLVRVNGVGITRVGGGYGVKVNLSQHPPKGVRLPHEVDGVPVRVEYVGPITKRGLHHQKS